MRTKRIIAIFMIFSSMLLQISYASTTSKQNIANTGDYKMHFSSLEYEVLEDYGCVDIVLDTGDGANIGVRINNIYPGVIYNLDAVLENSGSYNAKITDLSIVSDNERDNNSKRLYDMLVGVKDDTTKVKLNDYIDYLKSEYTGKIISPGQCLPLSISMGMDENVTDLENIICNYQIIINFEQVAYNDEDGDNDHNDEDNHNGKENDNDINKSENNNDSIDNNSNNQEKETTSVPSTQEEKQVFKTDSNEDLLPNTGEKSPIMVYGLGLVLMFGGILLLKKNGVKE